MCYTKSWVNILLLSILLNTNTNLIFGLVDGLLIIIGVINHLLLLLLFLV